MKNLNPCVSVIKDYLVALQNSICHELTIEDGQAHFQDDIWNHSQGGGGETRSLANGAVFEKAAVNFSHVLCSQLPPTANSRHPELAGCPFQALGISLVIHPLNPHVPTVHMNLRFFIAEQGESEPAWWFGGGFDLTPYYGYEEDCRNWHKNAKKACDPFGADLYLQFKKACDDYFYLPHRKEPRGIGGLFFDDWQKGSFEDCFALTRNIGDAFLSGYLPIVHRRKNTPYTPEQRAFQCYRRGRYVEFNLLYDRGTLFGLQSGGRTESILLSLPPQVSWHYQWQVKPESLEAQLYENFLFAKDWL